MWQFKNKETPLPTTRPQLLKDTLRYRFFEIVLLSIYCFLFLIPSIVWLIFGGYLFINAKTHTIYEIMFIQGINIPLIMIFGIGVAGCFYVTKKISFQEGESINHDFFYGIRKNFKMFLLIYFIIGFLYFLLETGVYLINNYEGWNSILKGALEGIMYGIFILFIMILFFMQTQTILYNATFTQLFKNALKFTFGSFLKNLGIFAILLFPFFIYEFVPAINNINYFQYAMFGLEGVFYFGFSFLIFTLYSNSIFDVTINKNQFPEYIRKGLNDENKNL